MQSLLRILESTPDTQALQLFRMIIYLCINSLDLSKTSIAKINIFLHLQLFAYAQLLQQLNGNCCCGQLCAFIFVPLHHWNNGWQQGGASLTIIKNTLGYRTICRTENDIIPFFETATGRRCACRWLFCRISIGSHPSYACDGGNVTGYCSSLCF